MTSIPGTEGERRLFPRPWDYSCYLLRELKRAIVAILESEVRRVRPSGPAAALTALDYGCGTRPYEPLFRQSGIQYTGADLRGNPQADVPFEPSQPLPLADASFDIVFSSQVLEHVRDVPSYLAECRRVLKPDGLLLLSTHGTWTYHGYPDDYYRWTHQGLRTEIEQACFSVTRMIPCVGPLAYTTHVRNQLLRGLLHKFAPITLPLIGLTNICSALLMPLEDAVTPSQVKFENAAVYAVEARKR